MYRTSLRTFLTAALLLGLLGCATPAHRIERNPELFASFPAEVQETVREGRIEPGYSADMVYIALGYPNRKAVRRTPNGNVEVWIYSSSYYTSVAVPAYRPLRHHYRDRNGNVHYYHSHVHVDYVRERHSYDWLRIEFIDGKVHAIESDRR